MPTSVPNVAANSVATSSWANEVANSVNELQGDLYVAGQLSIPWDSVSTKPPTFPPIAHAHQAPASGGTIAYADLTGKPTTFAPAAHAASHKTGGADVLKASELGGFDRVAAGGTVGTRIFVGTGTPSSPAEGDVWIKG